ncbi:plasmid pRiA4b ORF-3 family protein [Marinobacter sp. AC-23]|uniref:plasmid pRiA4b ORF-3 family protein n=1 Tax=Marinobacter sp. AC-23 TaxID=1879031 RepID=UPI0020C89E91|nr:plasmid pRiA4b ORF-3 family protein [Marinobacter sp. AC-23]
MTFLKHAFGGLIYLTTTEGFMTKSSNNLYQIKVSLTGAQPPIWRRLLIEPGTTFQDLHRIIQVAMSWQASHLHLFQAEDGRLVGDLAEDFDGMMNFVDESTVPVSSLLAWEGQALKYEYDFGDSWEHEITLEKILPANSSEPVPQCIKAVRQCPPEDIGGLPGFYNFLEIMEDMAHPDHIAVREWLGGEWFDPEFVDLGEINEDLLERHALFAESAFDAPLPASDLCGLSPNQVHELLQNPLNCPSVFKPLFNAEAVSQALDTAPVIRMAKVLIDAMGDKGIRLTSKGNLPLRQVQAMIQAGGEEIVFPMARFGKARSEENVLAVHLSRVLLEVAGFTKKQKGYLLLKKTAATRLAKKGWLTFYRDMFSTALSQFNWAWMDFSEGLDDVQYIGPFCFWLLSEKGGQWQPVQEYLTDMLKAFPRLPFAAYPVPYASEEDQVRWVLSSRMLILYRIFGLIELNPEQTRFRQEDKQMMRRTALFEGMFVRV